jgi:hypothetical protein
MEILPEDQEQPLGLCPFLGLKLKETGLETQKQFIIGMEVRKR